MLASALAGGLLGGRSAADALSLFRTGRLCVLRLFPPAASVTTWVTLRSVEQCCDDHECHQQTDDKDYQASLWWSPPAWRIAIREGIVKPSIQIFAVYVAGWKFALVAH